MREREKYASHLVYFREAVESCLSDGEPNVGTIRPVENIRETSEAAAARLSVACQCNCR
jgi:hypothetical protein